MGLKDILSKKIETLKIVDLDKFLDTELPKQREIGYKEKRRNVKFIITRKFLDKQMHFIMKKKIKEDIIKGETFTFENWGNDKKKFAILSQANKEFILTIYEKKI